jgi:hypothetical protein
MDLNSPALSASIFHSGDAGFWAGGPDAAIFADANDMVILFIDANPWIAIGGMK